MVRRDVGTSAMSRGGRHHRSISNIVPAARGLRVGQSGERVTISRRVGVPCHCERSEAISIELSTAMEIAAHVHGLDPRPSRSEHETRFTLCVTCTVMAGLVPRLSGGILPIFRLAPIRTR